MYVSRHVASFVTHNYMTSRFGILLKLKKLVHLYQSLHSSYIVSAIECQLQRQHTKKSFHIFNINLFTFAIIVYEHLLREYTTFMCDYKMKTQFLFKLNES